jgi:predicted 3-demethylubiquinone-9 3-methyltransferase (glyoxalase superfamily)
LQQITPCIWLDDTAGELTAFYKDTFPDFQVLNTTYYSDSGKEIHGHTAGEVLTITFGIGGYRLLALNGGPQFTPNPAISLFYYSDDAAQIDAIWQKLSAGGKVLMELDKYPFSSYYGWVSDMYGVSWQLMLAPKEAVASQRIAPSLLFHGPNAGRAQEAIDFYVATFDDARVGMLSPYPPGAEPNTPEMLAYGDFMLHGERIAAMDSALDHDFQFSEGVSLVVTVHDQETIDRYWEALSAVPESEACGWLKDKFGVSWQIVPAVLEEMQTSGTPEQIERLMAALMPMKKIDITALQKAYDNAYA